MNGTLTPSTDDELGTRIARAIDHAVASAVSAPPRIELATVRRGARRRQTRRNALVGVAVAAVVAAGVVVLAQRRADPSAADTPQVEVPVPPAIGAAAVLPDTYGDPVSIYASAGGQPRGMALPPRRCLAAGRSTHRGAHV